MHYAAFLAVIAFAAPAFAQTRAAEIVVTGERRPQETSTLAGNAAALTAEDLDRIGAQAASEALNRLPGVAIHRNNGVENLPAIRSPVLVGGQSAGSFLILEDGVPIRAPGFSNVNALFETSLDFASRVEIVRGPGSALYGSNAVHGIVNVLTPQRTGGFRDPAFALRRFNLEGGQFGRVAADLYFEGGAPNDERGDQCADYCPRTFEYLIGVAAEEIDGWRDDSDLARQHAVLGLDTRLGAWSVESRLVLQNLNQNTPGFIQGADAYKDSAFSRMNFAPGAYRDQSLARARITLSRDLGEDWRVALTPYARTIDSALQLFFFPSRAREETEQTGGGIQAAAYWDPDEDVSFIFGLDGDATSGALFEVQTLPDQPNGYLQGVHYDYEVDMRALAAYAQASWRFADEWRLVAGLRGEQVDYEYRNNAPDGDFGRFRRAPDRDDEFSAVTPKFGLVWTPTQTDTLWLNRARGARPPQITDLYSLQTTQNPGDQDVETIDSAELGWRGDLGPARVELALFHMDKRDTSFRNADGFTVTDGQTRHQGVELSGAMPLLETLDFAGWITYARHTYRFDDPVSRAGESITSGDDVDSAPRLIWNARLNWRPIAPLSAEIEWVHMGEYFTNAANTASYPGHDVFNLRADWAFENGVALFATIRNLANTDYAERADFAFGNDRYFPGEDRALTLGIRARR